MSTRYFNLEQAQGLLPEVHRLVKLARESRMNLQMGGMELGRLVGRIEMMGGVDLDPMTRIRLLTVRGTALETLRDTLESLDLMGVRVADLDAGIVDFPTRYRGEDACLMWKVGDERIRHWRPANHPPFSIKEIDAEFLSAHQGGPVH
ncbi:MAG: DUF2203 domain-containing protein [Bryobacter sp.]|jgi:hypothetical protein|nr:DUF2203 domain-containing protein [Bryobacter sp.]